MGSITSDETHKNVIAVCAVSATGAYLPLMFIYARQRHSPALENDGPRDQKTGGLTKTFSYND